MNSNECDDNLGLQCYVSSSTIGYQMQSITMFCDCKREIFNESYWNGSSCQPALKLNSSCTNTSTSYMCQQLTQGTLCNDSNGNLVFTCQCPFLKYFDSTSNKCINQLSYNQSCSNNVMCQERLGLSCFNGFCK